MGREGGRDSLGFTVPCSTTESCFASSILWATASLHMCESTAMGGMSTLRESRWGLRTHRAPGKAVGSRRTSSIGT